MKLIKISNDKIQIKTDSEHLKSLKINDLLLVADDNASLVAIVTGIIGNDTMSIYDYDNEFLGQTEADNTIECGIIGSLTDGVFTKSVDIYPTTSVNISVIDNKKFNEIISCGADPTDDTGGGNNSLFKIGTYASYGSPAMIDGNKLFQRHFAIVGSTGSGKSYTVASLIEKVSALKNSNVILLDLHGEYSDLSFARTVKIGDGGLDFPVWFLPFRDMYGSLLKIKDESATQQIAALRRAYYAARASKKSENTPIAYELEDIIAHLKYENEEQVHTGEYYKTGNKAGEAKTTKGDNNGKLTSIITLLEDKLIDDRYKFMCASRGQSYLQIFLSCVFSNKESNVKVLDLSAIPHDMIPTVAAVIVKLIYMLQLKHERADIAPVTIICEEAHVYIPASDFGIGASQRRLLEIFETIAKEGRKFGVSLCIVSQRPAELNKTIMAQCANFMVMKMSGDNDRSMMKNILPEGGKSIIDALPLFSSGDCIVIGDSSKITFKMKIDRPSEAPKSNTIDVWDKWQNDGEIDTDTLVAKLISE